MKRKVLILGVLAIVLAGGIGYTGGRLTTAHAVNMPNAGGVMIQGSMNLSSLLQPMNEKLQNELWTAKLHDASGQITTLPKSRPVLIVASWCRFCHKTLQLLSNHELLDKVQVVVALDDGAEIGRKPMKVTTVHAEAAIFEREMKKLNVNLPASQLLYSLPTDSFDKAVSAVPLLLVHQNVRWQELKGYVPNASVWRQALEGNYREG